LTKLKPDHADRQMLEAAQRIVEPAYRRPCQFQFAGALRQGLQEDIAFETRKQLTHTNMYTRAESNVPRACSHS
jgi:hypothetical protein